ncbi:hypothetical protein Tco_1036437, partial [Tanacetum coccineum]
MGLILASNWSLFVSTDLATKHLQCEADRLEMVELRSQAQDIEASFWDLE